MNLQAVLVPLTIAFFLAFISESLVEYFLGKPFDRFEILKPFKWMLLYASAVVGVYLAYNYKIDFLVMVPQVLAEEAQPATDLGMFLSGCLIGQGAEVLHKTISKYLIKSPAGELG